MIGVTKVYLPSLDRYNSYLRKIWKTGRISNHGPFVLELESKLKEYLEVKNLLALANGTLGLQIAIKALNLTGEIITTPFTYVASTSSIVWEGCQPVFVDIDPKSLCIDANKIEAAITNKTSAILAVHVYGNVCDVEMIEKIAKKHKLKVIYDSAHAFSVKYKGKSILNYGDINILSFHATKVFHTIEGGAITTNNSSLTKKVKYLRNFGHNGEEDYFGLGINGKMSEVQASMGLLMLQDIKKIIEERKKRFSYYNELLAGVNLDQPVYDNDATRNYGYYPVLFKSETELLNVRNALNLIDVFPRRYFYPSLTKLPYIKDQTCEIAEDVSKRIMCLPLFYDLKMKDIKSITNMIKKTLQ